MSLCCILYPKCALCAKIDIGRLTRKENKYVSFMSGLSAIFVIVASSRRSTILLGMFNKSCNLYGIVASNLCDYCNIEEESLLHIFCECDIAAGIWDEVIDRYNSFGYNLTYLTDSQILLGDPKLDPILNRILLTTKISIFKNKCEKERVHLCQVKARLLCQFDTEYFIARASGRLMS